jgi:hypothetical protein
LAVPHQTSSFAGGYWLAVSGAGLHFHVESTFQSFNRSCWQMLDKLDDRELRGRGMTVRVADEDRSSFLDYAVSPSLGGYTLWVAEHIA